MVAIGSLDVNLPWALHAGRQGEDKWDFAITATLHTHSTACEYAICMYK